NLEVEQAHTYFVLAEDADAAAAVWVHNATNNYAVDPNRLGPKGEAVASEMTGLAKNTTRIPAASGRRSFRVPDQMDSAQRFVAEVKNKDYQYLSSQLLDDKAHVLRGGRPGTVQVIIDERTKISVELLREHLNPGSPIKLRSGRLGR